MISQNCPKCRSSRVRRGYRPTPFLLKLIGRYNLLCDGCNLEFRGFAVPFTVNAGSRRSSRPVKKVQKIETELETVDVSDLTSEEAVSDESR